MMIFLGHLFLSLIISSLIIFINYLTNTNFLNNFLNDQLILTLASLVGFSVAAVIFLIGQLNVIELKNEKTGIFNNSRREIKHNIYFVLLDFVMVFLLLIFRPEYSSLLDNNLKILFHILNIIILALFLLIIFSIFEIMKAVFKLNEK